MPDLRMPLLGVAAWAGALAAVLLPAGVVAGALLAALLSVLLAGLVAAVTGRRARAGPVRDGAARRRGDRLRWVLGCLLVVAAVSGVGLLRTTATGAGPVAALAGERAQVTVTLRVTSDPRISHGPFGDVVFLRGTITRVAGRGAAHRVAAPVVVLGDRAWLPVELGATVETGGRLAPAERDAAALLSTRGPPHRLASPDPWWRAAAAVRRSIRDAVAARDPDARELVPALVVGDDAGLDPGLADDFRTTGLTHLLAVSGTNLTLLVGFLVVLGRWVGLRGRWLHAIAAVGIVGFVLLARTEPSVVRAAAMGTVALLGMGSNGRERGLRGLGVAVVALLLVDPFLAVLAGFALSVLATGGILLLAPRWRDAMCCWLPRWAAEAVSIPLAAQVACTPVVTALSGQVSLVAVVANLAAAPAVAPATVLGLAGGLVGLAWRGLGAVVAAPAAWSVQWIVLVAERGAALPTAALGWGTGPPALALVTALCLLLVALAPRVLRHRPASIGCAVLLCAVVLVRLPTPGWPPAGWVLAMCDVGQGDALVLNAGGGAAVVVDAGPEPALVDRCLRRLDVARVPLLVLTHFHADHVDGLAGVLAGRPVGEVDATGLADPPEGAAEVDDVLGRAPLVAAYGVTRRIGDVTLQTLWPPPGALRVAEEGSAANNASVVLLASVRGVRVLLTGDVEPPSQQVLARTLAGLRVDVLKVPHHGSRHQDLGFLTGLGARLALVSVGADNGYGHPAPDVVAALSAAGATVRRTDLDGDVVVVADDGDLAVRTRG